MMLNKIALLSSLLIFIFGTNAFAHSHLAESTPNNGEIVTETLKTITLSFETNLEPTSSFTLLDEKNTQAPISAVTINGNQLMADVVTNLENGAYTIHWKIIGEDGHPLEGDIPFTLQVPVNTEAPEQAKEETVDTTVSTETESATDTKTVVKEQAAMTKSEVTEKPSVMNYVLPIFIGLVVILGFMSYWFIFKRKQV
jgi:copper resistance protein C